MDLKSLEAKRTELENSFNNTKEQINNLTTELYRLQGEHRLVVTQINELTPADESEDGDEEQVNG